MESPNLAPAADLEEEIPCEMELNEEEEEIQIDKEFLLGTKTLPNIIQLCNAHSDLLKPTEEIQSGEFISELLANNEYFPKSDEADST
jgi:hypothetical protein